MVYASQRKMLLVLDRRLLLPLYLKPLSLALMPLLGQLDLLVQDKPRVGGGRCPENRIQ